MKTTRLSICIRKKCFSYLLFLPFLFLVSGLLSLSLPLAGHAAELSLSWNENPENDIAGYKIHYGTESSSYLQTIDVGNVQTYTLANLADGETYYLAATAYDTTGQESLPSGEITYTTETAPVVDDPPAPPPINPEPAEGGVTLTWNLNTEPDIAGYKIYYGTSSRTYSQVVDAGNTQSCTVSNLTAGTTYYFAATAYDTAGQESSYSQEVTYTMPAAEPDPPVVEPIVDPQPADIAVTLSWSPNSEEDIAGYKVYCGTASRIYDQSIDAGNTQTCSVPNLEAEKTYYFAVTAYDTLGQESTYSQEVTYTAASTSTTVARSFENLSEPAGSDETPTSETDADTLEQDDPASESAGTCNLYFPLVADDKFWETEICLINSDDQTTVTGSLIAYTAAGQEISGALTIALPPHAREQAIVGETFSNSETIRYIVFSSDSDAIVGYTKFYRDGHYRAAVPAVYEASEGDINIAHIASDQSWETGFSFINTTPETKTLTLDFDNGTMREIILSAGEFQALTMTECLGAGPAAAVASATVKNSAGIIAIQSFFYKQSLSAFIISDSTNSELCYPHIPCDKTWVTGVVAYNPSESPCNLTLQPYSQSGTPLTSQMLNIEGRGKLVAVADALNLPPATTWFTIQAESPLTGFEVIATRNGKQQSAFSILEKENYEGIFAKLEKSGWTGIALVNTEDENATVTLTAYDDEGNIIATGNETLNPHEQLIGIAENLFSDSIDDATYIAYTADREVMGFQLNSSSDNTMLDALAGM